MASTRLGTRLTASHRQEQARLLARVTQEALRLWSLLPVDDMDMRRDDWMAGMLPLLSEGRLESQTISNRYYRQFSQAETGLIRDIPPVQLRAAQERLRTTLDITGPARFKSLVGRGYDPRQAWQTSGVAVAGATSRLVLEAGREEVWEQGLRDNRAIGYLRVTAGDPCAFCAMLASRGPVYKSADTAAGGRWSEKDQSFEVHDACQCTTEAMYDHKAEWPGRAKEFQQMWNDSTGEAREAGLIGHGTSSRDALNAFRRKMEGRPVVSDRIRRPKFPMRPSGSSVRRPLPPSAEPVPVISAAQASQKVSAQRSWAQSQGWDVSGEGRQLVGVQDSRRIVWELNERGAWVVTDYVK
jgi:hypothetical protein